MIILTLRTDRKEAEIGLYDNNTQLAYEVWEAHRALAETLHNKIRGLLESHHLGWRDIGSIVVFQGPGSFTGLRIGISVANALAYSLNCSIAGLTGEDWIAQGIAELKSNKTVKNVVPFYGSDANITTQLK